MPVACPSCGAPLDFRTSFAVFAVCGYCGATVIRTDRDVALIGNMADLPAEMTPFQVGTEIQHGGLAFVLAGRVRMAWADGAWNEWFMAAGDTTGWLAEAQGTLAVSFPVPLDQVVGLDPQLPPDLLARVTVAGRPYRVTDVKDARCVGSEGELPFRAPQGRTATYTDMLGLEGGFASAEYADEGVQVFAGQYVEFDGLRARNLRAVEGWAAPAAS